MILSLMTTVVTCQHQHWRKSQQQLSHKKNNKASGPDNIPAELLKMGGKELSKVLYKLVERIWNIEVMPDEWLEGAILHLFKKGDKQVISLAQYRVAWRCGWFIIK